jgi:RNA polymerase sigma factor (TIGR02999 family)
MGQPGEITEILHLWRGGDAQALERLAPLVHSELLAIARGYMRRERDDHTLQPTALVSELYLRLLKQREISWNDRSHFYAFAAHMMRNLLKDHARAHIADRRGGKDSIKLELNEEIAWVGSSPESILHLDSALADLEKLDQRKSRVVELRCFLAMSMQETAEVLNISLATAERDLKFSRSWLYQRIYGAGEKSSAAMRS